jgi:DNA-binding GntR family transcriptional regulator
MEQPTPRGSKSTVAMAWVREQVLSGALPAGAVVRPEDVGRRLGISPTPAREGLQALRAEGFLSTRPGVGFVVEPLSTADIEDVFLIHAFLAGELAARAAARATEPDIDELEALNFDLMAASRRRRWDDVERHNHEFHRKIAHLAAAPKLSQMLGLVARYVPRSYYSQVAGWPEASARDHQVIVEALRSRDADAVRRSMEEHINHAGELLAGQYGGATPPPSLGEVADQRGRESDVVETP